MLFTNEGWELGNFGDWVRTGVGAGIIVGVQAGHPDPRTGNYHLRYTTSSSSTRWGRVTWTISDAPTLARLAGRILTYRVWNIRTFRFTASDSGNIRQIEVGDNVGSTVQAFPTTPYDTWEQTEVSHLISGSPTSVFFESYWYKGGFRRIIQVSIDDMESDPVSVPAIFPFSQALFIG